MIVVTKKDELYGVTGVTVGRLRSNPNAGTHGRRDHDSFDVSSLYGHRLHRIDPIDEGLNIFGELLGLEAELTNDGVDVASTVISELHLSLSLIHI